VGIRSGTIAVNPDDAQGLWRINITINIMIMAKGMTQENFFLKIWTL
jgi:hypothetical protein